MNRAPLKAQSGPYGVVTAPPGLGVDRTASKVTLLVDVSVSGFRRLCIWFGRRLCAASTQRDQGSLAIAYAFIICFCEI